MGGHWCLPTPTVCPEWTALDLLRHLLCTARRYHRLLDVALAGQPETLVVDEDLAELNRRDLAAAALDGEPINGLLTSFVDAAESFSSRALAAWGFGPFQRDGVDVGPAVAPAAIEWHIHAWDLFRAAGSDYYPDDPELLRQGWELTVPHLAIDRGDDPWAAVLASAGREGGRTALRDMVVASPRSAVLTGRPGIKRAVVLPDPRLAGRGGGTSDTVPTALTVLSAGRPVGGLSVFGRWDADTDSPTTELRELLGPTPLLRVGGLRGYSADVAVVPSQDRDEVAAVLVDQARAVALNNGCRDILMLWATEQAVRTVLTGDPSAHPLLLSADVTIPVPPGGFEEFLDAQPARRRQEIRREERRFDDANLRVETLSLLDAWESCAPLLEALQRKHGQSQPLSYWRTTLKSMAHGLPESVVHLASDADGPVGFSLAYPSGRGLTVRAAGFDYQRLSRDRAGYFNLAIYRMLRHA